MTKKNKKIAGLDQEVYHQSASEYSKGVIFTWLATGVVYSIVSGTFFELSTILLFLPGVFVISFASIPFFFLRVKKNKAINFMNERDTIFIMATGEKEKSSKDVPKLIFFTITSIVDFLFPAIAAIVFIRVMNQL